MPDMDLEKVRKGLAAALEAMGPEPKPAEQPAQAPAVAPGTQPVATSRKRTILQTEGNPICTDCDTGEKLMVADVDSPESIITALNKRHGHGNFLKCPTCRAAFIQTMTEGDNGFDLKDDGSDGTLKLVPKKK